MDADTLLEISDYLGLEAISRKLSDIKEKRCRPNRRLIIPVVGEFSAGKTSLLNAVTDNLQLETGITPTTAVVFEIYFSQAKPEAVVVNKDGTERRVEDIGSLSNAGLKDASLVRIYDTSAKIPNSVILADTPGLSSLDPEHQRALTAYLPKSDAVFMVVDVNQGVTRSMADFINSAEIARKRVYAVFTKADTKSAGELREVMAYLQKNAKMPLERIVSVSAKKGEVGAFIDLIGEIQREKNKIVEEIFESQIAGVMGELAGRIDQIIECSKLSTKEIDGKIAETNRARIDAEYDIERELSGTLAAIERAVNKTVLNFNDSTLGILEDISRNQPSGDINAIVNQKLNNVASLYFENFKEDIIRALPAGILRELDLDSYAMTEINCDVSADVPALETIKAVARAADSLAGWGGRFDGLTDLIGSILDPILVKAQRNRIMNEFIFNTLQPKFEEDIEWIKSGVIKSVKELLSAGRNAKYSEIATELESLKAEKQEQKKAFEDKIGKITEFKRFLGEG
jgi:GTPase Era involved in 16S rRNA processing